MEKRESSGGLASNSESNDVELFELQYKHFSCQRLEFFDGPWLQLISARAVRGDSRGHGPGAELIADIPPGHRT